MNSMDNSRADIPVCPVRLQGLKPLLDFWSTVVAAKAVTHKTESGRDTFAYAQDKQDRPRGSACFFSIAALCDKLELTAGEA